MQLLQGNTLYNCACLLLAVAVCQGVSRCGKAWQAVLCRPCGVTCTMGNRFCSCGRLLAAMQRSSQRVVRCVASSKRARSEAQGKQKKNGREMRVAGQELGVRGALYTGQQAGDMKG